MYTAAVITVSDRASRKEYIDKSGPAVTALLEKNGFIIKDIRIIPDEKETVKETLIQASDKNINLIITTGGTGFSERDITPEATREIIEKEAPGIAEYMRYQSMKITPRSMLSRSVCGIREKSLIINLPGSPKGAVENLGFVINHIGHGLDILSGLKE